MGGTSTSQQQSQSNSSTEPWQATLPALNNIVGQLGTQANNTGVTANETGALGQLTANAQAGNPYAPQIGNLATDLLSGGGAQDQNGTLNGAYSGLQNTLSPYTSASYLDPSSNPAFMNYMNTISNDVSNRVNGMFAGAGRDLSGANQQSLARGIAEGTAPVFANQYNQNVAAQQGAANSLYQGGNTTAGLLAGLNQTALGNRGAGVDASQAALQARDSGANQLLNVEALKRNLPLQNIGSVESLLAPLAALGGQQTGTQTQSGSQTMSPAQQAWGWMNAGSNLFGKLKPGGIT